MYSYSSSQAGSSYRGRGSYSSYSSRQSTQQSYPPLPPDRVLTDGLNPTPIRTLEKPSVAATSGSPIKPENLKYIGSYNWVDEHSPTIIVPGSPPEWRERPFPYRVPYDTGPRMVDQNGYRMGSASTLLPLLRAVDVVAETDADTTFDWPSIDVVTDRNGLRKLLRWLHHDTSGAGALKDFRIDIQLGGDKTLLLHRWEKRTRENAEPPRSGCGINFERASTSPAPGCSRGTGHHRIVQYDLDGLKVVVRFEVDACLAGPTKDSSTLSSSRASATSRSTGTGNVDDLADLLSGLNVQPSARTATGPSSTSTSVAVIPGGSKVPQSTIIELTTRSVNTVEEFDWTEQFPQLFLSGTPLLYLAVHQRGTFDKAIKHRVGSEEMRAVEQSTRTQRGFRQLVAVLRQMQRMAREHGKRGKLSLVCQDGVLKVYERTGGTTGFLEDTDLERFGV